MKQHLKKVVLVICALTLTTSIAYSSDDFSNTIDNFKRSPQVQPFFDDAYGYAVFPVVGKGGIGIGGAHGKGRVYQGGKVTGNTSMTKVSIGFQLGGQAFSEIIFFEDKRAYDEFTSGNFEFGANASAVAITLGTQAEAGSGGSTAGASVGPGAGTHGSTSYKKGMAVFVHIKGGMMYEASIGGQKFNFKPLE